MRMLAALLVVATGCAACPPVMELDDCVEPSLTVQEGVYGQVLGQDDVVGECPGASRSAWPGNEMGLLVEGSDVPIVEDVADSDGLYELPAAPGDYRLCHGDACMPITVPANGLVRVDFTLPFPMFTARAAATCN